MPGLVPLRRPRSSIEDDEDVSDDEHHHETSSPQMSEQNKRQRLDPESETSDTPGAPESSSLSPPRSRHGNAQISHNDVASVLTNGANRIVLEHKPGSIVRVTLTNFITYTAASFYPGPALNMVIGPNGTGKSTLVCAICLGLGWGPKHLGRAKDPGEFVKHGSSEATIEVELKAQPGKRNPVIRRQIKREGNKSSYFINGDSTSQSNVLSLARKFGIQVDNLCHFLPQDRVVEFAGLSPIDRLESTQRAAAPEYMVQWHEELKKLRVEQKDGEKTQAELKQNLTNLEGRQNLQRADVERIRERETLVKKVAMLEKLRPFSEQAACKVKHEEARERKRRLQDEFATLRERDGPLLRAVNVKEDYKIKLDKSVAFQKTVLEKTMGSLEKCSTNRAQVQQDINNSVAKRTSEEKQETDRKNKMGPLKTSIREIEVLMKEPPIEFDAADYNERNREKMRLRRAIEQDEEDTNRGYSERRTLITEKRKVVEDTKKELENLKSQSGKQWNQLKALSPDTARAWHWIQEHRDRFQGQVYGPPLLECTITDKRFVNHVETLLRNKTELCAITCTNKDDFKLLQNQVTGVMKLTEVSLREARRQLDEWQAPITREEMHNLGLEGWALDYITGPEPVLSVLCAEARLHSAGITLHEHSEAQFRALSISPVNLWLTQKSIHAITRRREYVGVVSTQVTPVQSARYFTDQAIDSEAERRLQDRIVVLDSEIDDLIKQNDQVTGRVKELKSQIREINAEIKELETEKGEKQKAANLQLALPNKLREAKQRLEECIANEAEIRRRVTRINDEVNALTLQKGQLSIDYASLVDSLRKLYVKYTEAQVAQIEAGSDLEELQLRNRTIKDELESKAKEVEKANEDVKARKEEYKSIMIALKRALDQDDNLHVYFESLPEEEQLRTPEELELEIESQKARLELLHEGDPRALREFEARGKDIERLQRQAAEQGETLEGLEQTIADIRAKWEPELDALVDKISTAFASSFKKINCAGDVSIYKEGDQGRDFEGWAIHIQVKFREGEELSLLDSHRQSGGERAVSTIFYLMALQSLSRAPFRVVDEINQGMDPRNERMVHERMVDIACGSGLLRQRGEDGEVLVNGQGEEDVHASQYFLITPKLLSDLKYKPGMKVHCIASGEYMPSDYQELDFKSLLQKARGAFGGGGSLVDSVGA